MCRRRQSGRRWSRLCMRSGDIPYRGRAIPPHPGWMQTGALHGSSGWSGCTVSSSWSKVLRIEVINVRITQRFGKGWEIPCVWGEASALPICDNGLARSDLCRQLQLRHAQFDPAVSDVQRYSLFRLFIDFLSSSLSLSACSWAAMCRASASTPVQIRKRLPFFRMIQPSAAGI